MVNDFDFDHINLNEIDDSFKPVDQAVYTLEVNKLEPVQRTINKPTSEYVGQSVLVLRGSFTIVDDEKSSGRKLWHDFWTPFKGAKLGMKKLMTATGMIQKEGQTLSDWATQYATLNPPARLQVLVEKKADPRDPAGELENNINFFQAKPC